jgi:1-deoxy-D-xylulose-5-phosphate reductoisomerase
VGRLDFFSADLEKFPNLRLAYEAGKSGGTMPSVLNAANEVAVEAFLKEFIRFTDMPKVIEETMLYHQMKEASTIEDILEADRWARKCANKIVERISRDL